MLWECGKAIRTIPFLFCRRVRGTQLSLYHESYDNLCGVPFGIPRSIFSWYEIVHICIKPFFEEKSISYSKDQKSGYICWFCQVVLSGNHHSSAKALLSYFLSDGIKATELSCSIKKNVKISAKEIPLPIEQQNRIYSKLVLALEILWRRILAMNHMKCTGKGC